MQRFYFRVLTNRAVKVGVLDPVVVVVMMVVVAVMGRKSPSQVA